MHPLEIRLQKLEKNIRRYRIIFAGALLAVIIIICMSQYKKQPGTKVQTTEVFAAN